MSVTEIKEAVGRLSAEELAEVSAFIESREADWLERCGKTADERLEAHRKGQIKAVDGQEAIRKLRAVLQDVKS
jgi:hypothetical protein